MKVPIVVKPKIEFLEKQVDFRKNAKNEPEGA